MTTARLAPALRLAVVVASTSGCGAIAAPRPQWAVTLATDAPVPQFGDEVLVEILDGRQPTEQRFLDASTPMRWPISFGIAPADPDAPVRVHVTLFRLADTGSTGLPIGSSLIEATAKLPPARGVTPVALTLTMACFGVPADVDHAQTCDPETGALAAEPTLEPRVDPGSLPVAGSWPAAANVGCSGPVPAGMACIPGGAFVLGATHHPPVISAIDPVPQHAVVLAPFALDIDEMTVGIVRDLVLHAGLAAPLLRDPNLAAESGQGLCTYAGDADPSNDALPANCLDWTTARSACELLGKRLPTEAEWEFAARNRTAETMYPWGSDPDVCGHAVVARGRYYSSDASVCELPGNGFAIGPAAGGAPGDRTALGVLNLGGNVAEWLADVFGPYDAPCWAPGRAVLVDPVCDDGPDPGLRAVRGGRWDDVPSSALTFARSYAPDTPDPGVGVRCAVSM